MRGLAEVLALLAVGTALALALLRIVHLLHMLQLEEYDTQRFVHWAVLHIDQLAANPMLDLLGLLGVVVLFLPLELVSSEGVIVGSLSIVVGLVGLLWERRLGARSPVKKALVMTPRARRLLGCAAILSVGTCLALLVRQARLTLAIAWLLPFWLSAARSWSPSRRRYGTGTSETPAGPLLGMLRLSSVSLGAMARRVPSFSRRTYWSHGIVF